jgi:hypothetical protein
MKLLVASLPLVLVAGCSDVEDDLDLGEIESAGTQYQGTQYQGTQYQGTQYQGTQYQGTQYQGTQYQGTQYQGTTYGGVAEAAQVQGTAIVVWTKAKKGKSWEQRFPDKICYWDSRRRSSSGCTFVDVAKDPSPLVGVGFQGTFKTAAGVTFTGTVTIGDPASPYGAVSRDTSLAMHPLADNTPRTLVTGAANGCDHVAGCAVNSDVWLYDLKLSDANGNAIGFCSATNTPATAVAGVYDATGQRTNSSTQFTFACTNGTIAKCTRWGYRSFGTARKWATGSADLTQHSMADYHQACVRAAAADYCGNGTSFTKNNTIVDISDYDPSKQNAFGFIPRTDGGTYPANEVTAVVWESVFDNLGAIQIDHSRFQETQGGSIDASCPGEFVGGGGDVLCPLGSPTCVHRAGGWSAQAAVTVDSTPACAHSELLTGKWLHDNCNDCTRLVASHLPYCSNPADSRGWDSACVDKAKVVCTATQRMVTHSECTTGPALNLYDSGCTLAVCLNPATSHCCAPGGTWDASCTAAANGAACSFAKKACTGFGGSCLLGLCAGQPTTVGTTTTGLSGAGTTVGSTGTTVGSTTGP